MQTPSPQSPRAQALNLLRFIDLYRQPPAEAAWLGAIEPAVVRAGLLGKRGRVLLNCLVVSLPKGHTLDESLEALASCFQALPDVPGRSDEDYCLVRLASKARDTTGHSSVGCAAWFVELGFEPAARLPTWFIDAMYSVFCCLPTAEKSKFLPRKIKGMSPKTMRMCLDTRDELMPED